MGLKGGNVCSGPRKERAWDRKECPNEKECQDGRNARGRRKAEYSSARTRRKRILFTEQGGHMNGTNLFPFHVMILSSSLGMRKLASSSSLPG